METIKKKENWFFVHRKALLIGAVGLIIGILFFVISTFYNEGSYLYLLFEHLSAIFIVVFGLHLIHEIYLREEFQTKLDDAVQNALPGSLKRVKKSGIIDVSPQLDNSTLVDDVGILSNTCFYFYGIHLNYINSIHSKLVDCILNRRCTVRILILHPGEQETLKKRAQSFKQVNWEYLQEDIKNSVRVIKRIYAEIQSKNEKLTDNFKAYFSREWVSGPVYGYDNEVYMGFYLQDKISSATHFLKASGQNKTFYNEITNHFESLWDKAVNKDGFYDHPDDNILNWDDQ